MLKPLTDPVDVGLLSASQTTTSADYPLSRFERLRESLARHEGAAQVEFRFHAVNDGAQEFPALEGHVRARPWLVCQRCLSPFAWRLESSFRVAFTATDEQAARVPIEYEGVVAPGGRVSLAELVEDELLLALPLVPMHETPEECHAPPEEAAPGEDVVRDEVRRPFARLRDLLDR